MAQNPRTAKPQRLPNLIGLTGNIATGKSFVANVLRGLGAHIIDADQVARDVVAPGTPTLNLIVQEFGAGVLHTDGSGALNRKVLGDIVFNDKTRLQVLETLMQPAVRAELEARLGAIPKNTVGVLEAIRLFEGQWHKRCVEVWVTHCPPETQIARLVAGRGMSASEARARVTAQSPQSEKIARADVILDTAYAEDDTRAQVLRAWHAYQQKHRQKFKLSKH
jgi:dephospho-CoA kinase